MELKLVVLQKQRQEKTNGITLHHTHTVYLNDTQYLELKNFAQLNEQNCNASKRAFSLAKLLLDSNTVKPSQGIFLRRSTRIHGRTTRIDIRHDDQSHAAHQYLFRNYVESAKACLILAVSLCQYLPDSERLDTTDRIETLLKDKLTSKLVKEVPYQRILSRVYPLCSRPLLDHCILDLESQGKITLTRATNSSTKVFRLRRGNGKYRDINIVKLT